ncbi:MAG: YdcH family protein [Parvibaculaceae bacterium]
MLFVSPTTRNKGRYTMALESHIAELNNRHKALETRIESELHHPASDDLHIGELKKQKLRLKEEIEKLAG